MSAPASQAAFTVSDTTPVGPAAFPFFTLLNNTADSVCLGQTISTPRKLYSKASHKLFSYPHH